MTNAWHAVRAARMLLSCVIGGYAIVSGALLLALALNIRTWRQVPAIV